MNASISQANLALVEASMRLRAISPEGWKTFVDAINLYAVAHRDAMLAAPPEFLVDARGQAHALTLLHQRLDGVVKAYNDILNQRKNKP